MINKLISIVLQPGVVTRKVANQLIAPIENILFFDEADGGDKLLGSKIFEKVLGSLTIAADLDSLNNGLSILRAV